MQFFRIFNLKTTFFSKKDVKSNIFTPKSAENARFYFDFTSFSEKNRLNRWKAPSNFHPFSRFSLFFIQIPTRLDKFRHSSVFIESGFVKHQPCARLHCNPLDTLRHFSTNFAATQLPQSPRCRRTTATHFPSLPQPPHHRHNAPHAHNNKAPRLRRRALFTCLCTFSLTCDCQFNLLV